MTPTSGDNLYLKDITSSYGYELDPRKAEDSIFQKSGSWEPSGCIKGENQLTQPVS